MTQWDKKLEVHINLIKKNNNNKKTSMWIDNSEGKFKRLQSAEHVLCKNIKSGNILFL